MKINKKASVFLLCATFLTSNQLVNAPFAYAAPLPKFEAKSYYKQDTDGDGIIDLYDKNPDKWDVSDRDLRLFMKLSYRDSNYIAKIFGGDETTIRDFNTGGEYLRGVTDVTEVTGKWVFVKQINNDNDGFSASIFANGDQVIVAFRGSDDAKDYNDDAKLFFGKATYQSSNLANIKHEIQKYNKVYLTGHSLGGYLSQYFASGVGENGLFEDPKFIHSALFNAPGIHAALSSSWEHKETSKRAEEYWNIKYTEDSDKRDKKDYLYKTQPYGIHGDLIAGLYQYPMTLWNNQVNGGKAHSSGQFFGTSKDDNFRKWFSTGYRLDAPYLGDDRDTDGILDRDELWIGTDYNMRDTDQDGFWDKIELLLRKDPLNAKEKPPYNEVYTVARTGGVNVQKAEDLTQKLIKDKCIALVSQEIKDAGYEKQVPEITNGKVNYDLLDYPENVKYAGYQFNVKVKATFEDGTNTEIEIPVIIEENKARPTVEVIEKLYGQSTTMEDVKGAMKNVPADATVKLKEGESLPTGREQGTHHVTVIVQYQDGSIEEVPVKIVVGEPSEADKHTPSTIPLVKQYNKKLSLEEIIAQIKDVPDSAQIKLKDGEEIPKTNQPRIYHVPFTITYSDQSKDEVSVLVMVLEQPMSEKFNPKALDIQKKYQEKTTKEEILAAIQEVPEDVNKFLKNPDSIPNGNTPGEFKVPVLIEYQDHSFSEVIVKVIVGEPKEADKNFPIGGKIERKYGQGVTKEDVLKAVENVPENATATLDENTSLPDGTAAGTFKVTVKVTYSDQSSNKTEVTIHVAEKEKEKVDKSKLQALVEEEPKVTSEERYQKDSAEDRKAYDDAVVAGKAVLNKEEATQEEVNQAIAKIEQAKNALDGKAEPTPPKVEVDKSKLQALVEEEPKVTSEERYQKDSAEDRKAYDDAVAAGKAVLSKAEATQEEVNQAVAKIEQAKNALDGKAEPTLPKAEVEEKEEWVVYHYSTMPQYSIYHEELPAPSPAVQSETSPQSVEWLAPYVFGYEDGTIHPNDNMTRAEATALVVAGNGYSLENHSLSNFTDMKSKQWYDTLVNVGVQHGLIQGYPDGSFQPNSPITRAEFLSMVMQGKIEAGNGNSFKDTKGHWAEKIIEVAYAKGYVSGYKNGKFLPDKPITRAEAIVILNKVLQREVDKTIVDSDTALPKFKDLQSKHWAYYDIMTAAMKVKKAHR